MMREYILRYRFPERRKDAHPVLLDIMPETYGVMVYQEDVIKVAHYYAGLDLGEADVLRRGMSGKFRSRDEFAKIRDKFFSNSAGLGRDPEVTKEVWRQIESFAGYAFSKGHSASYAVESYQSLFLKAHYPIEYMVATINNGGGFYRRDLYLHEARLHGASVEGPCVNRSRSETIVKGKTIFIGLSMIKDLESESIARILGARAYRGNFSDLYEFIRRTALSLDQITTLVRIGALRFTGKDKKNMLWEAHFLLGHTRALQPVQELFDVEPRELKMPKLESLDYEDAFDQLELLGMTLCSPFDLLRAQEPEAITAIELDQFLGKTITALGYMVAVKYTRTIKGEPMYFGTFLDTNGMFLDTVHFPDSARRYPFRGRGVYRLEGLVVEEFGFFSIEVTRMEKEPYIDDPRFRDIPLREGEKARQNRDKQHDDRENNHTGENVKSGTPAEIDRGSG